MDPVSIAAIIRTLINTINYLRDASRKVRLNEKECETLATHAGHVVQLIEDEVQNGAAADVLNRLLSFQQ
jgi:hypothetical protein